MDGNSLLNLALVVVFILTGGVFAGTEMAMVSLREDQVRSIESSGRRGAATAALVRSPNVFLSAVQIGVTVAGFFSSAYGAATLAPGPPQSWWAGGCRNGARRCWRWWAPLSSSPTCLW